MLKRKLLALAVPLCATLATAASAEDAHGATARDALIASINHAIVVADIDGLTSQYRSQDAVEHALAAMAIERVHGNFEQSKQGCGNLRVEPEGHRAIRGALLRSVCRSQPPLDG